MDIITLTETNFKSEVLDSDKPVLIDFFATWCSPCRMLSPTIESIANETADIKVCKVDVDEEPELSQRFGVASIPTLVVIKNGKVTAKTIGLKQKQDILALLD